MRTLDLTPLFRSSVGFDRMTSMLETASRMDANPANTYPPYNIERQSDDAYRITMAVAGFTLDDLEIEIQDQALTSAVDRARRRTTTRTPTCTRHCHAPLSSASIWQSTSALPVRNWKRPAPRRAGGSAEALRPRLIKIDAGEGAGAKVIEAETPARSTATAKAAKTKAA